MPRKLRRPLPPANDPREAMEPPPPIIAPQAADAPVKRGPGRPSKAEVQQRQQQERAAIEIKPDDLRPLTALVLVGVCKAIKGDLPQAGEVDLVNGPATVVANKYAMTNRYAPELALIGAVAIVAQASRSRAARTARENEQPTDRAANPMDILGSVPPPVPAWPGGE